MPATGSTRLANAETVRMRPAEAPIKAERVRPDALTVSRQPTVAKQANASLRRVARRG